MLRVESWVGAEIIVLRIALYAEAFQPRSKVIFRFALDALLGILAAVRGIKSLDDWLPILPSVPISRYNQLSGKFYVGVLLLRAEEFMELFCELELL